MSPTYRAILASPSRRRSSASAWRPTCLNYKNAAAPTARARPAGPFLRGRTLAGDDVAHPGLDAPGSARLRRLQRLLLLHHLCLDSVGGDLSVRTGQAALAELATMLGLLALEEGGEGAETDRRILQLDVGEGFADETAALLGNVAAAVGHGESNGVRGEALA